MNEDKIYVDVNATFTKGGMLLPKSFCMGGWSRVRDQQSERHPACSQLKDRRCRDAIYMCRRRKRSISVL